ncbi:MAG: segregation/condensation protein A [Planctomycetes bacterium]|nr:segregation/condensation protein A [Planctomycetota bacterium]
MRTLTQEASGAEPPDAHEAPEARMLTEDYRVRLESFEGPLDLLLFLIRKNEVDITDIPIAPIADQYIAFLRDLDKGGTPVDIEVAGEFLVMAATLMEIKSRWLARGAAGHGVVSGDEAGTDATDPRADLVRQLLAYKQYRDAADALEYRGKQWQARYPIGRAEEAATDATTDADAIKDEIASLDVEDLELTDLLEAFKKIVATVNFERLGDHQVVYDDTPIELHAADIVDRIKAEHEQLGGGAKPKLSFRTLLTNRTRSEMIGLFLAVLDLVRRRVVGVEQDKQSSEITLVLRDPDEAPADGAPVATPAT